jgi:thymidylate synthase
MVFLVRSQGGFAKRANLKPFMFLILTIAFHIYQRHIMLINKQVSNLNAQCAVRTQWLTFS